MHKSNCKYFKRSFRGKTLKMRFFAKNNAKFYYLLLPIFIASSIPPNSVSAVSYQTEITPTFTVNDTLSISVSRSDLLIDNLVPGDKGKDSNIITITVNTNNEWGYVLSSTVGNATYNNTNLTGVSSVFTNLSSEVSTLNAIPNNYWGYSFSTDNGTTWSSYNGLPLYTDETNTAILNESDARTANATTKFKIGAKAGSDQLSGTYQNVINFAVTNKPKPIPTVEDAFAAAGKTKTNGYYSMQDMTSAICSSVDTTGPTTNATLIDIRDNKTYLVGKLADNRCWLLDNLAFTGQDASGKYVPWDSTTTNITGTLTWSSSVIGMTSDYTNPKIYVDSKDCTRSSATTETGCSNNSQNNDPIAAADNWKYGVLYNFAAASAGSIVGNPNDNATSQDICPKGWRLPTGGSGGEYQALATAYSSNVTNVRNALHLPLSGYFRNRSLNLQGSYGYFWSSTAFSTSGRYYLYVYASGLDPQSSNSRQYGYSVRCVAQQN